LANFAFNGNPQAAFRRQMTRQMKSPPQACVAHDSAAIVVVRSAKALTLAQRKGTDSLLKNGTARIERLQTNERMTFTRQCDDVGARQGRFCATPNFLTKMDASRCGIEVCSYFASIFCRIYLLSERLLGATQVLGWLGEAASPIRNRGLARAEKSCA
jgi:hypothetical protein